MTKNCERINRLLDRYLRGELNSTDREVFDAHVAQCHECREALEFSRSLDSRLDGATEPPVGLRSRFEDALATPAPRRSWLTQVFGDPTMKKILISSTAVTAVLASALLLIPGAANASTARETFRTMRSALAKAARNGELSISASLTSAGATEISVKLNGQPLPADVPVHVNAEDHGDAIDYTVTVDLSDANFSSITYGKDHNTLKLVPKAAPNSLDVIRLDPKSSKPADWSIYKLNGGVWKRFSDVSYVTSDKSVDGPPTSTVNTVTHDESTEGSKASDDVITAHIRMTKGGGNATLTVKQN